MLPLARYKQKGQINVYLCYFNSFGGKKFVQSWKTTDNGLDGVALQHNDAMLVLDEIEMVDSNRVEYIAYMLVNERFKQRANEYDIVHVPGVTIPFVKRLNQARLTFKQYRPFR